MMKLENVQFVAGTMLVGCTGRERSSHLRELSLGTGVELS